MGERRADGTAGIDEFWAASDALATLVPLFGVAPGSDRCLGVWEKTCTDNMAMANQRKYEGTVSSGLCEEGGYRKEGERQNLEICLGF
jgi:hypothetical protein